MPTLKFDALLAEQGKTRRVAMISASASDIRRIATISRLGRNAEGRTIGFQRPQIAAHIAEIREYLEHADAVLPNCLVLAFVGKAARIVSKRGAPAVLEVDLDDDEPPGYVVDGQQRLTALSQTERDDFRVFASCLVCEDMTELRRQFILINNTKQISKSLLYELLPGTDELPARLNSRQVAATLVERLNFDPTSSLRKLIKMETNPTGTIKDTALQKAILNSESAGAVQIMLSGKDGLDQSFALMSNFFAAVQEVFPEAWHGHKPTSSRLVHGAGITAMGYVMDELHARSHAITEQSFIEGLGVLKNKCAWTEGQWNFADGEVVAWNHVENTSRQIQRLSEHLVNAVRAGTTGRKGSRRKSA